MANGCGQSILLIRTQSLPMMQKMLPQMNIGFSGMLLALTAAFPLSNTTDTQKEMVMVRIGMRSLSTWHYSPPNFDEDFSRRLFSLYLKKLDPQKRFFLQADIDSLSLYRDSLSEQLRHDDYSFSLRCQAVLKKRFEETRRLVKGLTQAGLKISDPDELPNNPEKLPYCKTKADIKKRWSQLIKYQVLLHLEDLLDEKTKKDSLNKTVNEKALPTSAQIGEALAYILRNQERSFSRMVKEEKLDRTSTFLNVVANVFDPHTEFFKPEAREEFNLSMTGTLEGIGAVLKEDDGYIKVVSIVPGSAAWREKSLKAEDRILKVAQSTGEAVDLAEASVQEAVRLIRGKKGTQVKLTIESPSGQSKLITITRDIVVVEDSYAKSAILQPPGSTKKLGYIALPSFYHDFANANGRTSWTDVKKELERLRAKNVDGIILDLRGNGGGALDDAVKMAGLFLSSGPVVQVKDRRGAENVLEDSDPGVTYAGQLIVMINTFSASASEILAAAMQDYQRAVIVGSDTSWGKGTVQTMLDLDNLAQPSESDLKPLGSLKLTVQKFYRVNGGTTQFLGVVPDILIPDGYSNLDIGEKYMDNVIPWDTVQSLKVPQWKTPIQGYLPSLKTNHQTRITSSGYFQKVEGILKRQDSYRKRKSIPLSLNSFFTERRKNKTESEELETLQKQATDLGVEPLLSENENTKSDSTEIQKVKAWKEQLTRDFYLRETANILSDLLTLANGKH